MYKISPINLGFSLCFLLMISDLGAQQNSVSTRGNSPYSRYGLGDLQPFHFAPNLGMARAFSATYRSDYDYDPQNPASLTALRATTFDFGLGYRYSNLNEAATGKQATAHDGNLSHLSLAFPLTRSWEREADTLRRRLPIQWTLGAGLMPHSQVAYDVRVRLPVEQVGDVAYAYRGQGNRYRVNIGQGLGYKGLSLGMNVGWILGTANFASTIELVDSSNNFAYNEARERSQFLSGFVWNVGLQYRLLLKAAKHQKSNLNTDWVIVLGAYGNRDQTLTSESSGLFRRYSNFHRSDTIEALNALEQDLILPSEFGFGLSLERNHFWRIGFNYHQAAWSRFREGGQASNLSDAFMLSLGGEYSPIQKTGLDQIRYRGGVFYGRDPRSVSQLELEKYGITFGLSIPRIIRRGLASVAFVHLGLEFGYMGHEQLIRERYLQVQLAATINDGSWFVRRKYR